MSIPYIEAGPSLAYNTWEEDVFWVVTKDENGDETARALFLFVDDAKEYLNKVKGMSLEDIKIVTGEE